MNQPNLEKEFYELKDYTYNLLKNQMRQCSEISNLEKELVDVKHELGHVKYLYRELKDSLVLGKGNKLRTIK